MTARSEDEGKTTRVARWLAERRTKITATDVPAILGLSPYASPVSVWLEKTNQSDGKEATDAMRWGQRFERPILEEYEEVRGEPLVFPEPYTLLTAPTQPLIGATLDAWRVRDGGAVDAKNLGAHIRDHYGEAGTDDFPPHYAAQLMMQLFVHGGDSADLAVLFNRHDFRIYTIQYDKETAEGLVERCVDWWEQYVVTRTAPPVDGTPDYTAFVKRFRQATDMVIRADAAQHEVAAHLNATKQQLDAVETEKARLENILKSAIGEAKGIEGPTWRALWSTVKDSTKIDWEAVARETVSQFPQSHPSSPTGQNVLDSAIAKHTSAKPGYRRLTFTFRD